MSYIWTWIYFDFHWQKDLSLRNVDANRVEQTLMACTMLSDNNWLFSMIIKKMCFTFVWMSWRIMKKFGLESWHNMYRESRNIQVTWYFHLQKEILQFILRKWIYIKKNVVMVFEGILRNKIATHIYKCVQIWLFYVSVIPQTGKTS